MFGFDTWLWVLVIASTVASVSMRAAQANDMRNKRAQATQDYYNKLQQHNQKQAAFSSSQKSSKDVRLNAQKYSLISDQLVEDATRREGQSKQNIERNRPLRKLLADVGNKYASSTVSFVKPEDVLLIAKGDFNETPGFLKQPDFTKFKFNVEKFNTNFLGEVEDDGFAN